MPTFGAEWARTSSKPLAHRLSPLGAASFAVAAAQSTVPKNVPPFGRNSLYRCLDSSPRRRKSERPECGSDPFTVGERPLFAHSGRAAADIGEAIADLSGPVPPAEARQSRERTADGERSRHPLHLFALIGDAELCRHQSVEHAHRRAPSLGAIYATEGEGSLRVVGARVPRLVGPAEFLTHRLPQRATSAPVPGSMKS